MDDTSRHSYTGVSACYRSYLIHPLSYAFCHAHRKLFKLTKVFAGGASGDTRELPLAVAEEGKAKVVSFQAYLPLIAAVCNSGLRERHWEALAELVGFTIKQDEVRSEAATASWL